MRGMYNHVGQDDVGYNHRIIGKVPLAIIVLSLVTVGCILLLNDADTSSAEDPPTSGDCGTDLHWTYTTGSPNTLTISGDGTTMTDYGVGVGATAPWYAHKDSIGRIVFETTNLKNIGNNAFAEFGWLENVSLPNTVTTIGNSAFYENNFLVEITIPDSVVTIGNDAFSRTYLIEIVIPDSVTTIGSGAFEGCSHLESVVIGKSVTTIGNLAFDECPILTELTINSTDVGEGWFMDMTNITTVEFGDTVTTIGGEAFSGCSAINSITLPDSLTSIGAHAFKGCTNLPPVEIPGKVTSIGNGAFQDCVKLESINIPDSVTYIGFNAFDGCVKVGWVAIGNSVGTIGDLAFPHPLCFDDTAVTDPVAMRGLRFDINADKDKFVNIGVDLAIGERTHTYNGTQHTVVEDSDHYTVENCTAKDAGDYKAKITTSPGYRLVWTDSDGKHDQAVCEFVWTVAPKVISITWGETVFKYDGKSHVPTATAAGLIEGDTCDITVSGSQTAFGKHTATATSLSNGNYALPDDATCGFTINAPEFIAPSITIGVVAICLIALVFTFVGRSKN